MRARHGIAGIVLAAGFSIFGAEAAHALEAEEAPAAAPAAEGGADPKAEGILGRTLREYLDEGRPEGEPAPDRPAGILRILGWTASVAVGFIALALAYRKFVPAGRILAGGKIRLVARAQISPRHGLSLVRVGNRAFLIGTAGDRIQRIAEFRDPAEVMAICGEFAEELARAGAPGAEDAAPPPEAIERFRGEIDRLRDLLRLGRRAPHRRETVS